MPPSSPASGERASGVRAASTPALEADWLGACRTATAELRQLLADRPTTRERIEETGRRGEGGDLTLVIDHRTAAAELPQLAPDRPAAPQRIEETGRPGEGGDLTVVIEQRAEDAVFAQLEL